MTTVNEGSNHKTKVLDEFIFRSVFHLFVLLVFTAGVDE